MSLSYFGIYLSLFYVLYDFKLILDLNRNYSDCYVVSFLDSYIFWHEPLTVPKGDVYFEFGKEYLFMCCESSGNISVDNLGIIGI